MKRKSSSSAPKDQSKRRPYQAPALVRYGSLKEMTKGGGGDVSEDEFGKSSSGGGH